MNFDLTPIPEKPGQGSAIYSPTAPALIDKARRAGAAEVSKAGKAQGPDMAWRLFNSTFRGALMDLFNDYLDISRLLS